MSRLDTYISRYGDFCAHDDNDTTDYFTLAHACGVIIFWTQLMRVHSAQTSNKQGYECSRLMR